MRPTESFDRKNVTEMGLELPEGKSDFSFDLKQDMTANDWTNLDETIRTLRRQEQWHDLALTAADMHNVDPTRDLSLTADDFKQMAAQLKKFRQFKRWTSYSAMAANMLQVGAPFVPVVTNLEFNSMRAKLSDYRDEDSWGDFIELAAAMRGLGWGDDGDLKEDDRKKIEVWLEQYRHDGLWSTFSEFAAKAQQLFPDFRLQISAGEWEKMRLALDRTRQGKVDQLNFIEHAAAMASLARHHRPRRTDALADVPPVPETKSYTS